MNPYQKRTTTSIPSTTAPRVDDTNHHYRDDETPYPHHTRPYSLLSNDVNDDDDDDMALNHYGNENDNDDDTTMSFSSSFLLIPRNSNNNNNNNNSTRLPLTAAATTTTTTAVPPTFDTTIAPFHSLPNHPIDSSSSSSSSSTLDDALQQFQMWVQQQHLPEKEPQLWKQQQLLLLQTHLQQILDLSQKGRRTNSGNENHQWTVAQVQRFVTSILLPLRQQWVPNNNNNTMTTESTIITGAILSTLCQLMEDASIWNQSHIYWAMMTTTIDHCNENDPPPYGTTKETSLCTILQIIFRCLIERHDLGKTTTGRASYDDGTLSSSLSGVVFRFSANIGYHQQSIRDHCTLLSHHSIDFAGSGSDQHPFCDSCWLAADDASTLLQIAVPGSVQSTPTAGDSRQDQSSQLPIIISCCSYVLQQMRQPQQSIKNDDDCIASLLLEKYHDIIVSMIHYVRTHIQNHHLSHPKRATSTVPQTSTDIDISLRYMEVLLIIYAKRYNRNSNRGFTNVRHRNILDDIRQLILVDHVFVQYIIETMLVQLDTAANFNHIHYQPSEMSLSIVKILYDLVPDTIDAILSSHCHPSTSWSVSISGTNHHRPTTHQPLLQDPPSLTHSYVYQAIHILATKNISIHPNVLNHTMECLLFLHTVQRNIVRQCIISYVTNSENETTPKSLEGTTRAISNLLQQLLYCAEIDHSLPAASFLEQLFTDATDTLRHDELSRRIWNTVVVRDAPMLLSSSSSTNPPQSLTFENRLWKALSTILAQHHQCQLHRPAPYPPILIQLVDLAYLLVRNIGHAPSSSQRNHGPRDESTIDPALIKCLLQVLDPENQNEGLESTEPLVSKEEDTPTAQNLSRCDITQNHDETDVWNRIDTPAFQSKVETVPTTVPTLLPREQCVQLSVATLLIDLTHHSKYWDGGDWTSRDGMVLRERILDTVNAYIVQINVAATLIPASSGSEIVPSNKVQTGPVSPDITRRRLRLLTVLAQQTDNEEWLSNVLHISEMRHRDMEFETRKRMDHYMLQVKAYQEQEEQLLLENKLLADQLASLDSKHQFERNEMNRKITQRAKQLVAVHTMDRQQMEQQVRQLSQSVVESQNKLESCQRSNQELQSILQETTVHVTQLRLVEHEHVTQIKHLQMEAHQASNDLANTKVSLQNVCTKNEKLEDELRSHADRVEELKQSEMDVQNCLENLFGDMVKLARAYVAKESEVDSVEEKCNLKLQEVSRCLQAEQERNKQFDKEDRQKQYDYDILQRKYQRLKEKLEQERQDHQRKFEEEKQRSKRNGPISYMNQLHHNASSMNVSTATTSSTAHKGLSNNTIDKENPSKNTSWANHRLDRAFR